MSTGEECIIHVVDDEEAARKSLAFLLTVAGFAVRVHESATSFLATAPSLRNACLITDLRMPDMTGVDLLQRLKADGIRIPSIVITGNADVPMAVEAMKAGAIDFIEKPFTDEVLIAAIRRAARDLGDAGGDDVERIRLRLAELTERENQILAAVVSGLPNKAIAFDLAISPRTVEVHRANVMSKMGARSLPELVRMAMAVGIVKR
jgi:two-component system response regulator FixJ